ncbi:hypothetical protein BGX26_000091 [Mortierella sp. AD094]|nr:hypothetical protein BGX26_000091 [Mortierella sp. AD094]
MYNSYAEANSIVQSAAHLSLGATIVAPPNSTEHTLSQEVHNSTEHYSFPGEPAPATSKPEEKFDSFNVQHNSGPDQGFIQRQREPNHPQLDYNQPRQEHNNPQLTDNPTSSRDAWADQGHFPLILGEISLKSIPARGGSRVLLSGVNFREGVEIVFECPKLGKNIEARVVKPRVLKSTEMDIITPNLLDWWVAANKERPCKQLELSVSLTCAGQRSEEDINTSFEMFAFDDSESELLHIIVELHRQQILASIKSSGSLDPETERTARQRTLTLLQLKRPETVSKAEHLALSVIYMLCDGRDQITAEGMDVIKSTTDDGHEMLHLAVIQGQTTLVREIARHMLGWFQHHPITSDSEVFVKNRNGETGLDFAKALGQNEIEQVLRETLEEANEFKKSILKTLPQPPTPPISNQSGLGAGNAESPHMYASSPIPAHALDRPLPPTPPTAPSQELGYGPNRTTSYFSVPPSGNSMVESPNQYPYPPAQSILAAHEPPHIVYENSSSYTNTIDPVRMPSPGQQYPPYSQHNIPPPLHSDPSSAYGANPHNIPPPRENSLPIPRPTGSPQGEQPSTLQLQTTAAPPLPPRHKVTRVNRPKQFTIPSPDAPQMQGHSPSIPHAHAQSPYQQDQYQPVLVAPPPLPVPFHQPMPMPTHQYPALLPMPMHQPPPSMHQSPPSMHQSPPSMHQSPSSMHQPPTSMHQPPTSMPTHHHPSHMPVYQPPAPIPTYQPPSPMPSHQYPSSIPMPMPSQQYQPMVHNQDPYGSNPDDHIKVHVG